jgi:hypothetical protein
VGTGPSLFHSHQINQTIPFTFNLQVQAKADRGYCDLIFLSAVLYQQAAAIARTVAHLDENDAVCLSVDYDPAQRRMFRACMLTVILDDD